MLEVVHRLDNLCVPGEAPDEGGCRTDGDMFGCMGRAIDIGAGYRDMVRTLFYSFFCLILQRREAWDVCISYV